MLIGYARVSTQDQNLDLQLDALRAAGCEKLFHDKASGSRATRPGLDEALGYARAGDSVVVWRLDRLGRSLVHLIKVVSDLQERGVGFRSLQESIDTTTSGGTLIFHVFGALAQFERNLIQERTQAGLAAARARGRRGGRPPKLSQAKIALLYRLYDEREHTVGEVCKIIGISKPTLYAYLAQRDGAPVNSPRRKRVVKAVGSAQT
ncbi:MAG: transposon DNA-invertase [Acidobacteria bacterium]|nr:MAG: transposon DNA-invertase [Acidobacteriota bacterium]